MAKILVTGATGFIGTHLLNALIKSGHTVYALCRHTDSPLKHESLHILHSDLCTSSDIDGLPHDIDACYYLMHSMSDISRGLLDLERKVSENFVRAIKRTQTKQIIYVGGILNAGTISTHLRARVFVENALKASEIPVTVLRASIIIGEGSASFTIIKDLVEKLPIMVAPRWIDTKCQPIAVCDVIFYLEAVLLNRSSFNKCFDIGGPNILTFKELLLGYAKARGLKRAIFTVPVLTPTLSSYWLVFITKVPFSLCYYLVDSMRASSICENKEIETLIPHQCQDYEQAIRAILQHRL